MCIDNAAIFRPKLWILNLITIICNFDYFDVYRSKKKGEHQTWI